ncbi:methyltransferase [Emydomyces testavorans]|uniref:Methyltransferase n=1 Tax=Emydomyces testavorans TaxID=2070801 RepID=A0AAF0DGA0_9EURO|nr:methyltransferase [Emydomyces testavorans]
MNSARNIYRQDVDFRTLALEDPDFAKFLKINGQLDFSDPHASFRQLTKSLLKRDFKLKVEVPDDRLCPPVPNRFNYILWLQDLIDSTSSEYRDGYDPNRDVAGLDIGRGGGSQPQVYRLTPLRPVRVDT